MDDLLAELKKEGFGKRRLPGKITIGAFSFTTPKEFHELGVLYFRDNAEERAPSDAVILIDPNDRENVLTFRFNQDTRSLYIEYDNESELVAADTKKRPLIESIRRTALYIRFYDRLLKIPLGGESRERWIMDWLRSRGRRYRRRP